MDLLQYLLQILDEFLNICLCLFHFTIIVPDFCLHSREFRIYNLDTISKTASPIYLLIVRCHNESVVLCAV